MRGSARPSIRRDLTSNTPSGYKIFGFRKTLKPNYSGGGGRNEERDRWGPGPGPRQEVPRRGRGAEGRFVPGRKRGSVRAARTERRRQDDDDRRADDDGSPDSGGDRGRRVRRCSSGDRRPAGVGDRVPGLGPPPPTFRPRDPDTARSALAPAPRSRPHAQ